MIRVKYRVNFQKKFVIIMKDYIYMYLMFVVVLKVVNGIGCFEF